MKVGEIKTLYIMNKFQVFLADNWLRIEKLGKKKYIIKHYNYNDNDGKRLKNTLDYQDLFNNIHNLDDLILIDGKW